LSYSKKKDVKEICSLSGEWTTHLKIKDKQYWKIKDYSLIPLYKNKEILLSSDSSFRKDLMALIDDDEDLAQKLKEEVEEIQRNDRKLREEHFKRNKAEWIY